MTTAQQRLPELLAPAGDWEALRAAVANGADAVYFGLSHFSARARATNFTPDELPDVMRFLHARNVRGFVAINTLIFSDELATVAELVKRAAAASVDAVIVQDLGLVRLIRRLAPTLAVHASTQMTLTEPRGIDFVRRLGVERVVLARELSLADIRKVVAGSNAPVEVFVHGALCVAYSGQCLTSEALGGRSANRGQCAQACRLPYEMLVDGTPRDLGDRAYLLSPQDLAAYDHIRPLIEAGAISFKIEGRLKGAPYVAATTQTYRKAIDAAVAERDFHLSRREELELAQTFSRGFTPGFLEGVNHQELVHGRFPKSRGVSLGKVAGFTRHGVKVRLTERLPVEDLIRPGDGVVFDLGRPEEKEPGGRVWKVQIASGQAGRLHHKKDDARGAGVPPAGDVCGAGVPPAGDALTVELAFEPDSIDLSEVKPGCDIWKTDDPALRKRLEQSCTHDRPVHRIPLSAHLAGTLGGVLVLTLTDPEGNATTATWPGPLEVARTRATTPEEIREQLSRLGDTPFSLAELALDLPANVLVPKSVLNDLRRQAAADLEAQRSAHRIHAIADSDALETLRASDRDIGTAVAPVPTEPRLTVLVRNLAQLEAVLAWRPPAGLPRPEVVYCDFEDLRLYDEAVARARAGGLPVGLATLRILKPGEEGFLSLVARAKPDVVLARNLASLAYFQEQLPDARLVADFSLNVANELTAALLVRAGFDRLVPSYDLNWEQLAALVRRSDPHWYEVVIHQHMPMFHMEHCVFAAFLSAGKDHRDCGRPCDRHAVALRDRVGATFPVLPDTGCRNTVFNSVAQSGAEYIGRMRELGLSRFRVELVREVSAQVGPLLDRYARVIAGVDDGRDIWRELRALNQLGVTRGTFQLTRLHNGTPGNSPL